MTGKRTWMSLLAGLMLALLLAGCSADGKVDQGRVVKFDKDAKPLPVVTMIRDKANDTQNPDYTYLPPITYSVPADPMEMGADPKAGGRMKFDPKKNQITIFDPNTQNFKTIDFTMVSLQDNIAKDNPLVFDKEAGKAKKFPVVDKDKKTITIYSGRLKQYAVISLPEEYFAYPEAVWDSGDEVRVYYKEEGKAARLMNITRTDIFKK